MFAAFVCLYLRKLSFFLLLVEQKKQFEHLMYRL